ncbi:MAG: glycosyltransferase family 4 protein [Acidobacteria bacterium]|nr:glycosyltransferase family 4 protein [Acidobacteriota bacterium]
MTRPVRLTAVLTHPIQYYAPWFRHIHAHAPQLALTVVYAVQPTPAQQGAGFDVPFEWDVPLTDGYESVIVRAARPGDRIDTGAFSGVDVPKIGDAIAATKPDVVLITGWYSKTLVRALAACRRLGVPVLFRGDSHLQSGPAGWRRWLWVAKTWTLLRMFAGYLSPGTRVDEYLARFGVPDHRVFRVPHGVDNDLFAQSAAAYQSTDTRAAARRAAGIDPSAFVVLFSGKLVDRKRPLDVIRAAARTMAPTTVVVAGAGPLDAAMREEAARLGVELRMLGFLNQTQLGRAYAIADCLALPSDHSETWGLVVNEALATGLPVIVSDAVGCAPDLVHEQVTGSRYRLGDVAELAEAIDGVRQRMPVTDAVRAQCRAAVATSDVATMTSGLVRACRSVIRHSPGPEPDWRAAPRRAVACCGDMVIAGGLERMTFEVLRVMGERGIPSHAIVNGWENFRITPLADASGSSWSIGPYWYPLRRHGVTPLSLLRMVVEVTRVSADLLRVARRVQPTHVLLPEFEAILRNWPALAWLRARGVHVVARQGTAPPPGRFYGWLWRSILDPVVDHYVANSEFTRREIVAHGIATAKVETINNIAPRRAATAAPIARIPNRVIFVGQIIPEKGVDLLLEAAALVRARGVDVTVDVVGDIDGWEAPGYRGYHATVRERALREDLRGAVCFLGLRDDVPSLLARSSLHCCPSRLEHREGFGVVVLEAKLAGIPSVVTRSGNLPDMIAHRQDGWICDEPVADAVADGVEFFLRRPEQLAAAGQAARRSAENYSEERFTAAWAAVFADGRLEQSNALC